MYNIVARQLADRGITLYRLQKDTGITKSVLYAWKNGKSEPKLATLIRVADYLGLPLENLVRGR